MVGSEFPSLAATHRAISRSDPSLHHAMGYPLNHQSGRDINTVYDATKRIFERADPELWQKGAIQTHRELAPILGDDTMLCAAVDGTWFRTGRVENRAGSCPEEAEIIDGGMLTRVKGYGRPDIIRGYPLTILSPTKSGVPLVWDLGVAGRPTENGAVPVMLETLYGEWPKADIQFMVGDSKYDTNELCRLLQFGYGIHAVFPIHMGYGVPSELNTGGWRDGVLYGPDGEPMEYVEADGFQTPQMRRDAGLPPGKVVRYIDGNQPRVRLRKPGPLTVGGRVPRQSHYTWHHPRFHTFLPHANSHADRWAARQEMMAMRNVAESVNASLQLNGLNHGAEAPRYLNSVESVHHFVGAKAWAMGRRKLLRLNGTYERMEWEFRRRGFLSEATDRRDAHHHQLALFA